MGPLGERLGYFLRRAQISNFQDFHARFRAFHIRPAQYSVLTLIEHNPGLTQSQVAEALGIKKTNFVAVIAVLEKRGLVTRASGGRDKRSYALHLTAQGLALMPRLHKAAEAHEARLIALIGADQHRELFAAMQAIAGWGAAGSERTFPIEVTV